MTALVLTLAVAVAAPVAADPKADTEFDKQVNAAREKAIKFLKEKQDKNGSWDPGTFKTIGMDGGVTALVALAMLDAGVPANDPVVTKALEYLLTLKLEKTYVVGLQTQVFARADAKKYAKEIQAHADWLMKNPIVKDKKFTGWSYPGNEVADNSNTHFAVMGLHAAAQAGAKVDVEIWQKLRDLYTKTQHQDGGWAYQNVVSEKPSQSMTVAALLGLTIATKYDKNAKGPDAAFEKGMALLLGGKLGELGQGKSIFVGWMTTAELGRAIGSVEFKSGKVTKAWYREGCAAVLYQQKNDGSFAYIGNAPGIDRDDPAMSTACGLFFLGAPAKK